MAVHDDIIIMQNELAKDFPIALAGSKEELLNSLAASINHLIQTDFSRLVNILYRLDISEQKLKETLQTNPGTNAGELIAILIVERQLQKQKSRNQFKRGEDIPDDGKW